MSVRSADDIAVLLKQQAERLAAKQSAQERRPPASAESPAKKLRADEPATKEEPLSLRREQAATPSTTSSSSSDPNRQDVKVSTLYSRSDFENQSDAEPPSATTTPVRDAAATANATFNPRVKGSAHKASENLAPTYTDRSKIPPGTSTSNKTNRPHDICSCRRVDDFQKLNEIAEGTFGRVFRAKDKETQTIHALKQVKMDREKEGFPLTSLREIDVLMSLSHDNIVDVQEIVIGSSLDSVYLVMEYVEHDLKFVMEGLRHTWTISQAKCLLKQLLDAVAFLHENWVIHRDLKSSNLLYTNRGVLKVCDFGLARLIGQQTTCLTSGTCTLWYRSPEVLLDATDYTVASDVWAVGCIFAEIILGVALWRGTTDANQTQLVFQTLGMPNKDTWARFEDLPKVKKGYHLRFTKCPQSSILKTFFRTSNEPDLSPSASPQPCTPPSSTSLPPAGTAPPGSLPKKRKAYLPDQGVDLLSKMLTYDPAVRVTAAEALKHPFFAEQPLAQDPAMMPSFPATNDRSRKKLKSELEAQHQAAEKAEKAASAPARE